MKLFTTSLLASLLVGQSLCATIIDAADVLYYFSVYELDVKVWGTGSGYVATGCRGSRSDGSCNYTEFVNYLYDGEASNSPVFPEIESSWQFSPGASLAIITTTWNILSESNKEGTSAMYTRLIDGREAKVGIWSDMGFAIEKGRVQGAAKDISIGRHLANVRGILSAVSEFRHADANTRLMDHLRDNVRSVVWETVEREAQYRESNWQEIEWEKTVKNNPDMKDPTSNLFKEVTNQINEHLGKAGVIQAKTINAKAARSLQLCF